MIRNGHAGFGRGVSEKDRKAPRRGPTSAADPFSCPESLGRGEYAVADPSFDERPTRVLAEELFTWMRERALQIRDALLGHGRPLIAAARYLDLLASVDPMAH